MKIISDSNVEKLKELSTRHFGDMLKKAKSKNTQILLLLSGGSSFEIIKKIEANCLENFLTIGILDERFESDTKTNNFLQLKEIDFYHLAKENRVNFIESIPCEGELLEDFAKRIGKAWRDWRIQNSNGKIFTTQGVGADGHTAGIMPYGEDKIFFEKTFEDKTSFVAGYDASKKNQYPKRATATLPFLRNEVDASFVWIVGKEKTKAFNDIMSEDGSLFETPARIIREMKNVIIFTDMNHINQNHVK